MLLKRSLCQPFCSLRTTESEDMPNSVTSTHILMSNLLIQDEWRTQFFQVKHIIAGILLKFLNSSNKSSQCIVFTLDVWGEMK